MDETEKAAKAQKAADKKQAKEDLKQAKADDKLAATPSPSAERAGLGDWAVSNNPSPEEQLAESERQSAIDRIENR